MFAAATSPTLLEICFAAASSKSETDLGATSRTAGSGADANNSPFVNETDKVCVHVHGKAREGDNF